MKAAVNKGLSALVGAASTLAFCTSVHAALLNPTCTTTATALNFGNYNPFSSGAGTSSSTITVTCSAVVGLFGGGTVNYTIALNSGSSGTYSTRTMRSGTNSLNYNLYTASNYSTIWGDGSGGSSTVSGSGTITLLLSQFTNTHTVYGQIPASQTSVVPGSYTDTINVTLTY